MSWRKVLMKDAETFDAYGYLVIIIKVTIDNTCYEFRPCDEDSIGRVLLDIGEDGDTISAVCQTGIMWGPDGGRWVIRELAELEVTDEDSCVIASYKIDEEDGEDE